MVSVPPIKRHRLTQIVLETRTHLSTDQRKTLHHQGYASPSGKRDGSLVKSTACSSKGPELNYKQPHSGS